jgi:hypothetical protein
MSALTLLPDAEIARAATYARQALSPATLAAYAAGWADFERWCGGRGVAALAGTPVTIAAYLAALAGTTHADASCAVGWRRSAAPTGWRATPGQPRIRRSATPWPASPAGTAPWPAAPPLSAPPRSRNWLRPVTPA